MADRRTHIAKEVLSTERTFCKQLRTIVDVFLLPLRLAVEDGRSIIKQRHIEQIFSNVEEIMRVSVQFLFLLEQRLDVWNDNPCLGDVFVEVLPEFDVYDKYMMDHHRAIVTITQQEKRSAFAQFLTTAKERPECENLGISALLITPVQRILRYKLLLEDLIKHTPDDHPDHKNLALALAAILTKAVAVNESIKAAENYEKLCQIQKSFITGNVKNLVEETRLFVREGSLTKVCRKIPKKRWFFLFSDVLIYASVVSQSSSKESNLYSFHRMLQLGKTKVKPIPDTDTQKNAFQIITNDKSFTVFADTPEEKNFWLRDLNERTVGASVADSDDGSAPVWVPDSGGVACTLCSGAFTFMNRRHHCRQCGNLVCGACSNGRIVLQHSTDNKPVRVCDQCAPPPVNAAAAPAPPPSSSQPVAISAPTFAHGSSEQATGGGASPEAYLPQSIAARQSIIAQINLNRTTSKPGSIRPPTSPLPPTPPTGSSTTNLHASGSAPSTPVTPSAVPVFTPIPTFTPVPTFTPLPDAIPAAPTLTIPASPNAVSTSPASAPFATLAPASTSTTPTSPTAAHTAKQAGKPIPPTPNGVPVLKRSNTVAGAPGVAAPVTTPAVAPAGIDTPPLPPKPAGSRNTLAPFPSPIPADADTQVDRALSPRPQESVRDTQVLRNASQSNFNEAQALESEVQVLMANLSKMLKCEAAVAQLSLINRVRYFSAKIHEHNVKYNAPPSNPPPTPPASSNPQALGALKSYSTNNLLPGNSNAARAVSPAPASEPAKPNGTAPPANGTAQAATAPTPAATPAPVTVATNPEPAANLATTAPATPYSAPNGVSNGAPNGTPNSTPNGTPNGAPNAAPNGVPNGAPKANVPAKPVSVLRSSNNDPPALPVLPPRKANQTAPRPLPASPAANAAATIQTNPVSPPPAVLVETPSVS